MRKAGLLIASAALVACAKTETAKTDSAAMAAPSSPPALTAADVAGTVTGQVMAEGSDSVLFQFTCMTAPTGNESRCVNQTAPKDTIVYTYSLSADSVMWTSAPYTPPTPPKSPQLVDHVVGRMSGNAWSGTTVTMLAAKPDSVVMRTRWRATKAP